MDQFLKQIQDAGVVGAGGAGFPSYVKMDCQVELVLANGAECEPLLHKDQVVMQRWATEMLAGMQMAMVHTGATRGMVGIKNKHQDTIDIVNQAIISMGLGDKITVLIMRDVYPAGDEVELVYEATGKRIPSGGLPKDIGVVVQNSESFINIFRAAQNIPVTHSMVTVHGAVKNPITAWLPIGISVQEALALAGGTTIDDFIIIDGGPMMGGIITDLSKPITKLSSGLIVLPKSSPLAIKKTRSESEFRRIGKAACDQCSLCTSMCPRNLLGYPVKPHLVMRSLQTSGINSETYSLSAQACSECNLCTMWSCPEGLDPRNICVVTKQALRREDKLMPADKLQAKTIDVHPMREYRGVPTTKLIRRLGLYEYYQIKADFLDQEIMTKRVCIPLSQHIGAPAEAVVCVGDKVSLGQLIGKPAPDKLSVAVHASINGVVEQVTDQFVIIGQ